MTKDILSHLVTTGPGDNGLRLDKTLAHHLPALSRSRLQALIASGQVRGDGRILEDAALKVKPGMNITVAVPPAEPTHIEARDLPLTIIFEDEHLLVIDKQAGMTVHPAPGHRDDTLVNALLAHCGGSLSGIGGVARPGIVHRLDKDTSGLMVVAKHDAAHQHLAAQLADRSLKRTYLAFIWGHISPASGKLQGNIGRSPKNRQKMAIVKKGGREALTNYKIMEKYSVDHKPLASLVECSLHTGRTHQIRVHFSHAGHGLVGDTLYGNAAKSRVFMQKSGKNEQNTAFITQFPRQALHAMRLAFIHPETHKKLEFECPLPPDMKKLHMAFLALNRLK